MSRWQTVDDLDETTNDVPKLPGVYVIFVDKILYYIGSSNNLYTRMRTSFQQKNGSPLRESTITVKYVITRRYGDWLMREARLIRRLNPSMNVLSRLEPCRTLAFL